MRRVTMTRTAATRIILKDRTRTRFGELELDRCSSPRDILEISRFLNNANFGKSLEKDD